MPDDLWLVLFHANMAIIWGAVNQVTLRQSTHMIIVDHLTVPLAILLFSSPHHSTLYLLCSPPLCSACLGSPLLCPACLGSPLLSSPLLFHALPSSPLFCSPLL